jgi:hypothetical protein
MKRSWSSILLLAALTADAAWAQVLAQPTPDELRRALQVTQTRVVLQQNQLKQIHQRMLALDAEIENNLDQILKQLAAVKDSQDSGVHVAGMKEQALAELKSSLDFYRQERARRLAQLNARAATRQRDELLQEVKVLDAREEKRVDQIVELATTLTAHKDYRQYNVYRDNWGWDYYMANPVYFQNKRESTKATLDKEQILKDLKRSADDLTQYNQVLKQTFWTMTKENDRERLKLAMQMNDELLKKRRSQIQQVLNEQHEPTRKLGRSAAFQMEQLLHDLTLQVERDFNELGRLGTARDVAYSILRDLEAQQEFIRAGLRSPAP